MSRICQVTGKKPMVGNTVSHANNKKQASFFSRIFRNTAFGSRAKSASSKLKVSTHGMRIIDKRGIDAVLAEIRARGEKI